jgi:hypothetical protein
MQAFTNDQEPPEKGKERIETAEDPTSSESPEKGLEESYSWSASDKKLVRKIDFHLLPWICLLYALALIDRYKTFSRSL